jgi:hypothetical protein
VIACFTRGAKHRSPISRRRLAPVVLALAAVAPAATAQVTVARLDVGSSRVTYGDSLRLTATAITPAVTAEWPFVVARAVASHSWLSDGGTSIQGVGGFSVFTPPAGVFLAEVEGVGGGTRTEGTNTSQVLGIARGHAAGSTLGAWIGGGGGTSSNGGQRRATRLAEVGAWVNAGPTRASISVSPTTVEDTIRYTDIHLAARTVLSRLELTAIAGSRSGRQPAIFGTPVKAWASATVVSWITQSIAIVAGGGRYPVDLTQGFPGGSYGSVGLRMAARRGENPSNRPQPASDQPVTEPDPPGAAVGRLHLTTVAGSRRLIYVRVPAATTVEFAGDFNAWSPVQLTRRPDGWWSVELEIERGAYETGLRIDGGAWIAPPGLTAIRDEFAGEGGILIVP